MIAVIGPSDSVFQRKFEMVSKCIEWEIDRSLLSSLRFQREQRKDSEKRDDSISSQATLHLPDAFDDDEYHVDDCWTDESE